MTSDKRELASAFTPSDIEGPLYKKWIDAGYFTADANSSKEPFTIVIPPPNVTGNLHIGHALDQTLQDCLTRMKRMQGFEALWLPGMDHAGIATQNVVEKQLASKGQTRHDLGREEFVKKVWEWKAESGGQILGQMKLYKPTVKFSEDENGNRKPYPPTVKVALRKKGDAFETVFFDSDKKQIQLKDVPIEDLIVKRMTVTALIECTGVWISSVGCGLSWKAKQVKIVSRPDGVGRGYAFVDDDEDSRPRARQPVQQPKASGFASAFDDEDEVDDEAVTSAPAPVEEEPVAVPAKVKTLVKKKVVTGAK